MGMTMFNSIKCFLGIGILATPSVFGKIGIVGGNIGMLLIAYIALYTMQLQIRSAERVNNTGVTFIKSYSDLGAQVLGACGKQFIDVCIIFSQLGFATAYLIFIGSQLDQVVCFETELEFCDKKPLYVMMAVIILIPISWLRDYKYLGYVSVLSNICLVISRKLLSPCLTFL